MGLPRPMLLLICSSAFLLVLLLPVFHRKSPNQGNPHFVGKRFAWPESRKKRLKRRVFSPKEEQWERSIPEEEGKSHHHRRGKTLANGYGHGELDKKGGKTKRGKALANAVVVDKVLVLKEEGEEEDKPRKRKRKEEEEDEGREEKKRRKSGGGKAVPNWKNGKRKSQKRKKQGVGGGNGIQQQGNVPVANGGGNGGSVPMPMPANNPVGGGGKKKKKKAASVIELMLKMASQGATSSDCQWCVVQFLEKAMLGPFAPLTVLINPKTMKRARMAMKAGKSMLANKQAALDAAKKGVQQVTNLVSGPKVAKAATNMANAGKNAASGVKKSVGKMFKFG